MVASVWDRILDRAARAGSATVVIGDSGERVDAAAVVARAEALASGLHGHGIGPGTVVMWQVPVGVDAVLVMLALARLGATQVPLAEDAGGREARALARTTGAELVLTAAADTGPGRTLWIETMHAAPRVLRLEDEITADRAAACPPGPVAAGRWIFPGTGTAGARYGVRHTDATLLAAANGLARCGLRPAPGGVLASTHSPGTVAGVVYQLSAIVAGVPLLPIREANPAHVVGVLRHFGVTIAAVSPELRAELVRMQRALPRTSVLLPELRMLRCWGEPHSPRLHRAAEEELGTVVARDYGTPEFPLVTVSVPADSSGTPSAHGADRPIPGLRVRIATGDHEVRAGVPGEIQVFGRDLSGGHADPAHRERVFTADGWFRTGDRGRLDVSGALTVLGKQGGRLGSLRARAVSRPST
ncbi:AMP-binding protein [Nocardia sp. NPDC057227]|uniref:AMP-binding protein n=1 Tax=Nocardia sp. NPDC057227 TaxID=3346056 RepID=UPI003628311C